MNREQMIEQLAKYRDENGFYDVAAIIRDERPEADSLSVTLGAFFGDGDEDRSSEDSPLVALGRELNEARGRERDAEAHAEIKSLVAELETASGERRNEILNRLVALGAGQWIGDGDDLEFVWNQITGGPYDDQGGLEENAGRPTWGGFRPGAGRPARGDGRKSRLVRVAVTDEEMEAITAGTDPDARRAVLMDRASRKPARRFTGETIIGGEFTEEELEAARAVGAVNAYRQGVHEVITGLQADAPEGWTVTAGGWTHDWNPPAPEFANKATEPVLLGFIRVRSGDPRFPVWLYKRG